MANEGLAVYIHWPWCLAKCPYCAFTSFATPPDEDLWREACQTELAFYAARISARRVGSVYIGGGTPSMMNPATLERLLATIARFWPMESDVEITLEANPATVDAAHFQAFRDAGVKRLSLGIQALREDALRFLGRIHGVKEARQAIEAAVRIFPRLSLDLIYARPGQTPEAWTDEVREALAMGAQHLSLYQLTVDPRTAFATRVRHDGACLEAAPEDSARLFETTQEILREAGFPAYEVSNHARPGEESRHNRAVWRYQDYLGIGPAAHGRLRDGGVRFATENPGRPDVWAERVAAYGHGAVRRQALTREEAQREARLMGLRLVEGLNADRWRRLFNEDLDQSLDSPRVDRLVREGLAVKDAQGFRTTPAGLQRLEAILRYLERGQG